MAIAISKKSQLAIFSTIFFLSAILPTAARAADSCPTISRDAIIKYAASGVGSPYVWGGDKWDPNNRSWGGADCSGFVSKAWQVPKRTDYTESGGHPYTTYSFYYKRNHWYPINRSELKKGDILVYRNKGKGHTVIYHYGDKWGSPVVYDARSKEYGIIHGQRYFPSSYKARRRHNLVDSDPKILASVKTAKNNFQQALPDSHASNNVYFAYFGKGDSVFIRNGVADSAVNIRFYLLNQNTRKGALNKIDFTLEAYKQNNLVGNFRANGYVRVGSTGQSVYALRVDKKGFKYIAKNKSETARSNFINYFEPKKDVLYLTNPNPYAVKAYIYLLNNGRVYSRKAVRVKKRSVTLMSYKRRRERRLKSTYVRVNSKGGAIFASKKTNSAFLGSAQPASKLSKLLYLTNFVPKRDLLYLTNPASKKARVIVKYIKNGRSLYAKRLLIKPKDVIVFDRRRRLRRAGEVFIAIKASRKILASKRMIKQTYQLAEPASFADTKLNISDFNPASEILYITNPLNVSQKALVNIYANSSLIYSYTFGVEANSQKVIDLRNTNAALYSNTYVNIEASLN